MRRLISALLLCSVLAGCTAYGQMVSTVMEPARKASADVAHKDLKKGQP